MNTPALLVRGTITLAVLFAMIALPIALVSALSSGGLISLNQGIVVFISIILLGLVVLGLVWLPRR